MEYKYYRELKHNYLIFESINENDEDEGYQYRIAGSGRIKGLVPCTMRNINGGAYLYYEINSMQTLKDRFSASGMGYDDLKKLIVSVKELLDSLSEFLLDEEDIVFNIQNVYTDLTTGEYGFIFCPFFDEPKSFSEFSSQLLELVDEKDERAVELIYRLCELTEERRGFVYEVIEAALSIDGSDCDKEENEFLQCSDEPRKVSVYTDEDFYEDSGSEDLEEENDSDDGRLKRAGIRLGGKVQILLSMLFAAVVGGMVYVRTHYILSGRENMLSILVMLVSAVTGAVALIGGFKEIKRANKGAVSASKKEEEKPLEQEKEPYEEYDDDWDTYESGYEDKERYQKPLRVTANVNGTQSYDSCQETVVLDEMKSDTMTLFSRNLDKTMRIALDKLPLTIGKMEGCVDKVLTDKSISRIHCRFVKDGDRVAVLDLGSTNGTYRNGERIEPQKKIYLDEGDEIRIGRVCFDCR